MSGFVKLSIACQEESRSFWAHIGMPPWGISLMSAPAEKARSSPVRTTHLTSSLASALPEGFRELDEQGDAQRIQGLGSVKADERDMRTDVFQGDMVHESSLSHAGRGSLRV